MNYPLAATIIILPGVASELCTVLKIDRDGDAAVPNCGPTTRNISDLPLPLISETQPTYSPKYLKPAPTLTFSQGLVRGSERPPKTRYRQTRSAATATHPSPTKCPPPETTRTSVSPPSTIHHTPNPAALHNPRLPCSSHPAHPSPSPSALLRPGAKSPDKQMIMCTSLCSAAPAHPLSRYQVSERARRQASVRCQGDDSTAAVWESEWTSEEDRVIGFRVTVQNSQEDEFAAFASDL
ncbi:hypothetical protein BKA80DRAFT_48220 [Phyllosticta citrichinensis]